MCPWALSLSLSPHVHTALTLLTPPRRAAQALRTWFADAMTRLPSLRYIESALTCDAEAGRVCMEYTRRCDGDPDMAVAELLEVAGGRIVASRVYHG